MNSPLAGVLREAWAMYRAHARHLLTLALAVYVVAAVVEAVLAALLGAVVGGFLALVVSLIAAFVLQAALVKAVEDVRDGRADLSLGETVGAARPYLGQVAIASIVSGLVIGVGLLLLIIPGLVVLTLWCLIVPVIVLEGASVFDSFGRSRALVRGHGLQVFGTLACVFLLTLVAQIVLNVLLLVLPAEIRGFVSGIVSGTLVAPFVALVLTMGYFRLRAAAGGTVGEQAGPAAS
ncbi:hypothetical protein [Actinopolymorpha pittospori]|uniref:Glycerophosphoryl diester phosphodiesterase membrane domain-containing protein n=2 Tax=Actinopolymorpha pittospori TaxID=648752 RepID=A0A927RA98_9ACTN|nr:hypothetical protein [Actinopolymorpha pittospori]MBE1604815.1 hypothetical protein [Actinopolymorpha pittospori]